MITVQPRPARLAAEARKQKKKEARTARAQQRQQVREAAAVALARRVARGDALRVALRGGLAYERLMPALRGYWLALQVMRRAEVGADVYDMVADVVCAIENKAPGLALVELRDGSLLGAGLVRVALARPHFIRPLETWQPPARAAARVWDSLVAHCFHRFPTTKSLDVMLTDSCRPFPLRDVLVAVGAGRSLRDLDIPMPVTKAMAHALATTRGRFESAMALVRDAQGRALGLHPAHRAVLRRTLAHDGFLPDESGVAACLQFLARHPEMSVGDVEAVCRGLCAFTDRVPSMKGRTPRSLVALCREARRFADACAHGRADVGVFPAVPIEGGRYVLVEDHRFEAPCYVVEHIADGGALVAEGMAMRHCVGTYAKRAKAGEVAIFGVRREACGQVHRALTVEVNVTARRIEQVRGKANRRATDEERAVLRCFSAERGLSIEASAW
jgi:hypothetical protein